MAPTGTTVRVDRNRPIADNPARDTARYAAISTSRSAAWGGWITSPDRSVTGPMGNSDAPIAAPARPTVTGAATQNANAPAYLTSSNRTRPAGATSRYRRVPRLASPAMVSPATTPMVRGRNRGTATSIAVTATNSPF